MPSIAASYNGLPTLHEADSRFNDRQSLFGRTGPLLAKYNNQFGLCLVHVHCTLEEGELMVSRDDTSQPERGTECWPERWLATGEAYEFSSKPTQEPPATLLAEFREIVGDIDVLGLYYVGKWNDGTILLEARTGADSADVLKHAFIETAWLPVGPVNPAPMACVLMCDTNDTKSEGVQTDTEIHVLAGKLHL